MITSLKGRNYGVLGERMGGEEIKEKLHKYIIRDVVVKKSIVGEGDNKERKKDASMKCIRINIYIYVPANKAFVWTNQKLLGICFLFNFAKQKVRHLQIISIIS